MIEEVGKAPWVWKDLICSTLLHHTPATSTSVHWLLAALLSLFVFNCRDEAQCAVPYLQDWKDLFTNTSQPLQIWLLPKYYMLSSFHFHFMNFFMSCDMKMVSPVRTDWLMGLFRYSVQLQLFTQKKIAHFPPISTLWDRINFLISFVIMKINMYLYIYFN